MIKRKIAILVAVLLVFSMIPAVALGAQVSLDLTVVSAAAGDSITASGSAEANEWVSIKAVDSSGSIVFYDAVKSSSGGDYECTFKVPQVSPGDLTIIAGYGSNVASKTLTIVAPIKVGNGGGGAAVPSGITISSSGGTVNEAGVVIIFPANAVSSNIKVKVKKLTAGIPAISSGLKLVGDVYEITIDENSEFNKPITITLTYEREKVDSDKVDLGIYYWDNHTWVRLSQVKVDTTAGKVSGEVNHFSKFAVLAGEKTEDPGQPIIQPVETELKDIVGHWAETSINSLVTIGAVSGYPDGSFKPDSTITRAEFASILVKAFKLEAENGKVFNDTTGHWAKENISIAAAHGIVNGYSETAFGPNDLITREEMAVMISKAAGLTTAEGKAFADDLQIAHWAKIAVASASGSNIMSGYPDNTFKPKANATRAEAVTVIYKAIK